MVGLATGHGERASRTSLFDGENNGAFVFCGAGPGSRGRWEPPGGRAQNADEAKGTAFDLDGQLTAFYVCQIFATRKTATPAEFLKLICSTRYAVVRP
jgi:hypothetical protein